MNRCLLLYVFLSALAACSDQPANAPSGPAAPAEAPERGPMTEPVVMYVDAPGEAVLMPVLEALTADTGLRVTLREAPADKNLDDVMTNSGAPPADILLTAGVGDIWTAGDEGALRRLESATGIGDVPETFRDPDAQWFTLGADPLVIVYGSVSDAGRALGYADLGGDEFEGQLCLSSSELPGNRALIAHLIKELESRPAERVVRLWMRNLALPPYGSAAGLLEAVQAGTCRFAIARRSDVLATTPPPAYRLPPGDAAAVLAVYGIGLARHARYADSAAEVLAWLAGSRGQEQFALATRTESVSAPPSEWSTTLQSELGWLHDDARRLAERARWR